MSNTNIDRQFRRIEISEALSIKVKFVEIITQPSEKDDADNIITVRKYAVESEDIPHPDLINLIKKLKSHALSINEMEIEDSKKLQDYRVSTVDVSGDILLQKSRVKFIITKSVKRTGKSVLIPTGQTVMYGDSDYVDYDKMTKIIEDLIEEVWAYLAGKYNEMHAGQLPLFSPLQFEHLEEETQE